MKIKHYTIAMLLLISLTISGCSSPNKDSINTETIDVSSNNSVKTNSENTNNTTSNNKNNDSETSDSYENILIKDASIRNGNILVTDDSDNTNDILVSNDSNNSAPIDFELSTDLKGALCQLACSYENYNQTTVTSAEWKEVFLSDFIQNSRFSYSYLNTLMENESGIISPENLKYIETSLTGIPINFDSAVNAYEAASKVSHGEITNYDYTQEANKIKLTADFNIHYSGTTQIGEYKLTATLVVNPDSCFDGYSIEKISRVEK